ncbi:hypothetical protein ACLUEY_17345, partial [Vreelandella aquamarina]
PAGFFVGMAKRKEEAPHGKSWLPAQTSSGTYTALNPVKRLGFLFLGCTKFASFLCQNATPKEE